ARYLLREVRFGHALEVVLPFVSVVAGPPVEVIHRAGQLVGARTGDHVDLAATVAAELRGDVAREDAEFRQRIRIRSERREVRAARARFVRVDAVERVVPGPVARAVDVHAAARVGPGDD